MAELVAPGSYTVEEVFALVDFDVTVAAAVDYNDRGWDARRVTVGGLSFDDLDRRIKVQPGADPVEIEVDGVTVATLDVVEA